MLFAVLDDLGEDFAGDVGDRNDVVDAVVLDHVLDGLRLDGDRLVDLEDLAIGAAEDDLLAGVLRRGRHGI